MINLGSDVVVLPPFSCVGTVTREMSSLPEANPSGSLPPHPEDIVGGSHPSLVAEGSTN